MSSIQSASSFGGFSRPNHVTLPLAQVTVQIDPVMGPSIDVTKELCEELKRSGVDVGFLEELLTRGNPVVADPYLYFRIMGKAVILMRRSFGWSSLILNRGYCELIRNVRYLNCSDRHSFCSYTFKIKEIGINSLKVTPYDIKGNRGQSCSILAEALPSLDKLPSIVFFPESAQKKAWIAAQSIKNQTTRERVQIILAEGIAEREKFIKEGLRPPPHSLSGLRLPGSTSCGCCSVSIHSCSESLASKQSI
jgi:hypothetical protein